MLNAKELRNFNKKVNFNGPVITSSARYPEIIGTKCHIWTAGRTSNGYGKLSVHRIFGNTGRRAHIIAKMHYHGYRPQPGLQCNHKCNNKLCVNPNHIYVGTSSDNKRDITKKPDRRLTYNELTAISWLHHYKETQKSVAEKLGITESRVFAVLAGTTYRK